MREFLVSTTDEIEKIDYTPEITKSSSLRFLRKRKVRFLEDECNGSASIILIGIKHHKFVETKKRIYDENALINQVYYKKIQGDFRSARIPANKSRCSRRERFQKKCINHSFADIS